VARASKRGRLRRIEARRQRAAVERASAAAEGGIRRSMLAAWDAILAANARLLDGEHSLTEIAAGFTVPPAVVASLRRMLDPVMSAGAALQSAEVAALVPRVSATEARLRTAAALGRLHARDAPAKTIPARAARWAESHAGEVIIKPLRAETLAMIRQTVTEQLRNSLHPRYSAKIIRKSIGLLPQHAASIERRRAEMVARLRKAGVTEERGQSRAAAWAERHAGALRTYRAGNIARTETWTAINRARDDAWRDFAEAEPTVAAGMVRTWMANDDERLCEICAALDNAEAPLDGDWETDDGPVESPPAHPSCRCTVIYEYRG